MTLKLKEPHVTRGYHTGQHSYKLCVNKQHTLSCNLEVTAYARCENIQLTTGVLAGKSQLQFGK